MFVDRLKDGKHIITIDHFAVGFSQIQEHAAIIVHQYRIDAGEIAEQVVVACAAVQPVAALAAGGLGIGLRQAM